MQAASELPAQPRSGPARSGFLVRVESVRGLAALCVALTHTLGFLLPSDEYGRALLDQSTVRNFLVKLVDGLLNGETAVIVFFVISGVVIGRSLDSLARRRAMGEEFIPFLVRRVLRLYPAHLVATVGIIGLAFLFLVGHAPVDFAAYPGTNPETAAWINGSSFDPLRWRSVLANLTMGSWSLNLVVWSLYCEVVVAPLLPLFHNLARRGNGWLDAAVLAALIALAVLNWNHLWSRYLFVFYLGMMVETHGLGWARAAARRVGGIRPALALLYLAMVLPNTVAAHRSVLVVLLEAMGAFGVISLIVLSETQGPLRSLERPLLRWNGRLSYSFYLWHYFIMTLVVHALYATQPADVMHRFEVPICLATALVTIAVALAVAHLSYACVEVPSMAVGRRLADTSRRMVTLARRAFSASGEPGRRSATGLP
jgi:peptidoglycan/LPS O-acetylase OafA/YrhL